MIGKISGRLELIAEDHVMIDTGGVGYIVYCSDRTRAGLPGVGAPAALFTDLVVREDLLQLFGFPTIAEREWHRLLMTVQGVGAKAALAIQGTLGAEGVGRAIALGDATAIKAAPGVGPKIAQRVVLELKDKAPAIMALGATTTALPNAAQMERVEVVDTDPPVQTASSGNANVQADALSALINLGYGHGDAAAAIAQVMGEQPDATVSDAIKAALKRLAPAG